MNGARSGGFGAGEAEQGGAAPAGRRRGGGAAGRGLASENPAAVLAGARNAFIVMVGVLAMLWGIQVVDWAGHYQLVFDYGIRPHVAASLPDIFTAPFLHISWAHIEANSGPLFIFGFLAAFRGVGKFAGVTAVVIITSGLAAWLTQAPHTVGVGASGVVFGYFGYIMVRGFFDRRPVDMVIGLVMALCFAYQFLVLLPHAGIGWQAHLGGLAGGVLAGWAFQDRIRVPREQPASFGQPAPRPTSLPPAGGGPDAGP